MKRVYEKPGIYVENFSLVQSIADGCGAAHESTLGGPTHADKQNCGWDMGNLIIWVSSPACNKLMDENVPMDGVCYNNPNGGASIFAS